jgi:uncharacterized membrane protein YdjX (TVP38/TMEM64 family)
VAVFLIGLVLMAMHVDSLEHWLLQAEGLRTWLLGHGAIEAATTFFALNTLLCAFGVPRLWTSVLAGAVFGAIPGLLLSLPSSLVGAALTFEFGRLASEAWLADAIPEKWRARIALHATPDILQTAFVRQLPVPGTILTLLLATGGISRRTFLIGSGLGFLPGAVISCFLGTVATTRQTPGMRVFTFVIVAVSVGSLAWLRRNHRLPAKQAKSESDGMAS